MSYQYAQFSVGFDVLRPSPQALRFNELVELQGDDVIIIHQVLTGHDDYGNPEYTESETAEKAIIKVRQRELYLPPGEIQHNIAKVLFRQWASVAEENHEVEINGDRYHIVMVYRSSACLEVEVRRMVE